MGQVLHRSATTTEAIRRAIQHSQESLRSLARRHGINPKTVAKWKKRESTVDRRTGPTVPKSTVLTVEQEAIIVAFRKHTLLPLDDETQRLASLCQCLDRAFEAVILFKRLATQTLGRTFHVTGRTLWYATRTFALPVKSWIRSASEAAESSAIVSLLGSHLMSV